MNNKNENIEPDKDASFASAIISFSCHFISIPIFIILHKHLPDPDWTFHFDRILLFIVVILMVEGIFQYFKHLVIIGFLFSLAWLTYGSIRGEYGFSQLLKDYKFMIYSMKDSPHPEELILSRVIPFPNKSEILKAIDYDNSEVRNFALLATSKHYREFQEDKELKNIIQCLAIFKEINEQWHYVSDPKNREYFAKASESIVHFSGDCDDHSILMAACIKSIGGTTRLIHTSGHLYPELLIGNKSKMESINYLIKKQLFKGSSEGNKIHYHIDEKQQAWINLDYTADYPGGKFMSEEILGILPIY